MNLISWNWWGLGNVRVVCDLCQMAREKRSTLLFLTETKRRHYKLEHIRVKLGFDGLFIVYPVGRSGGLALSWKESGNMEIQNFTRHIHAVVTKSGSGAQ
jgi:hypothetical protein